MFDGGSRVEILRIGTTVFILIAAAAVFAIATNAQEIFPTKDSPLVIDKKNRRVLIYTEINHNNLSSRNTHFGVVSKDGSLAKKAILKAFSNHLDFYDALIAIGANPGNNLTKERTGKYVDGDKLIVTVTWPGLNKELSLNDIFSDSSGKWFRMKFGGNRIASEKENTGCITCLESCWVGITSNSAYPVTNSLKRLLSPNSYFRGNYEALPAQDGHPVILTYRLDR